MINILTPRDSSQLDKIYALASATLAFTPERSLMEWIDYWLAQLAVIRQSPELLLAVCEGYSHRYASGAAFSAAISTSVAWQAYHIVIVRVHEQLMLQIGGWDETSPTD